jgi:hypothetical protein
MYYRENTHTTPHAQVKTIVLMAMRRTRDEELFSNYNFIGRATPERVDAIR